MRWTFLFCALLAVGCAQEPGDLRLSNEHHLAEPKLEFLGVAGVLIHWRGEGVLLDPFFSRSTLPELFWLTPDTAEIDRRMPPADDVTMLLLGHGHYDHALDVAWVMQKHAPQAITYGSTSAVHMLRAEIPKERLVDAQPHMASLADSASPVMQAKDNGWFYTRQRHIRAMPIQSMHAPNPLTPLMSGAYSEDLARFPRGFWNWKDGQTLAWLVDLLGEDGKPAYRIHYQDSAADAPYGFPPALKDDTSVNVEILPVASFQNAKHYPEDLLTLTQPDLVVLVHWEDFVGGTPDNPKILRQQKDVGAFIERVQQAAPKARAVIPRPLSEVALAPVTAP